MKKDDKYKIILLRGECPALEQALNERLTKEPDFLVNFADQSGLTNHKLDIHDCWGGATFLAVKKNADIHNLKHTDVLLYASFSIKRPHHSVGNLALISFAKDIKLVCDISGNMLDRLFNVYNIDVISFTAKEGATLYRLFDLVTNSQKLRDKYFSNWLGRYVGYRTKGIVDQAGRSFNQHIFEILRIKNDNDNDNDNDEYTLVEWN